jgi:hypothetical protein
MYYASIEDLFRASLDEQAFFGENTTLTWNDEQVQVLFILSRLKLI